MGAVMRVLLMLLCLLAGQAWGETLYLRSSTACPNNGDGTAYACAASAGAAGAFNSSANANVLWGAGAGSVSAGDTLYVCGNVLDLSLIPSISGTAGSKIKISGLCPLDYGYIRGGANNNFTIDIESNKSYFEVSDLSIGWAKRTALFVGIADSAGANSTDFDILRNTISNVGATTVVNHCHAVYFNSITGTAALYRINNVRFIGNKITGTESVCASSNNDNVNLENLGTGAIIRDNESYGGHEGFDISTGTNMVFSGNYLHDNTHSGVKFHGIMGCATGTRAFGNIIEDNGSWGAIWQDQINGYFANNTIKHAGLLHGLDIESVNTWSGACVPTGNTYANNYISADYNAGSARIYNTTKAAFEAGNTWNGNILRQVGSQTTLIYWTSDTGNNITQANFAANWLPSHPLDQQQITPVWRGGTAPDSAAGYCIDSTSNLYEAGTPIGSFIFGYGGESLTNPPPIGARGLCQSRRAAGLRRTRN